MTPPVPGARVVLRHRLPAGSSHPMTDVLGVLESLDPVVVRAADGRVVTVDPSDVVALKAVPPRPIGTRAVRQREHTTAPVVPRHTGAMQLLPLPAPGATPVRVLTIAGSDSGGSAGVEAELRTMALAGVHGCVALTAVTVQNSLGVTGVHEVPADVVAAQVRSVVTDIGVGAVKTGVLVSAAIIDAVAEVLAEVSADGAAGPLVLDPVAASVHGDPLLTADALDTMRRRLFPLATLLTPNLDEVRLLTGIDVTDARTQAEAARALHAHGPRWVLVKGGHLHHDDHSTDLLFDGTTMTELSAPRVRTPHDHGAGDTLATATACALAHGWDVPAAVAFGKEWVTRSVAEAYPLGAGRGPVSAFWRLRDGVRVSDARPVSSTQAYEL